MTRIDVWLWSVRAFKTRSMATTAVKGGHIRLNDDPVKPAKTVKPGDRVTIHTPGWDRVLEVVDPISRRVGAPLAVKAYRDLSLPRPEYLSALSFLKRPTYKEMCNIYPIQTVNLMPEHKHIQQYPELDMLLVYLR